ncbi:MAG: acyl carrier protein [Solirubrobacterales bacterium]
MERQEVMDRVRAHLAAELEVDEQAITESTHLRDDLDADSLDLYELLMELEDTYDIRIPEAEAAKITTVSEAVDAVHRHVATA